MSEIDIANALELEVEADLVECALKILVLTPALLGTFLAQPEIVEGTTGLCCVITPNKNWLQSLSFLKSDALRIHSFKVSIAHSSLSWGYAW